jgi:hypothetical protein
VSLGNGAAAWAKGYSCSNEECDWTVVEVSTGAHRPRVVESPGPGCNDVGCGGSAYDDPLPVVAGRHGLLVYAGGSDSDQVKQIVGRHAFRLFTVSGDIERLLVGGGAIEAISRALVSGEWTNQRTFLTTTGQPLASLPGVPVLSGNAAAVASTTGGTDEITLSDALTGTPLATVALGPSQPHFSLAGADTNWIVFHRGTSISALNVVSHELVLLATRAAKPLDLSVSGRQVVWAENINGRGRIRTLDLPK